MNPPLQSQSPLLETRNLRVQYLAPGQPPKVALHHLDLQVSRGRTLGVVGESGSGKSSLAKALVRLVRPTAGEILFAGTRIDKLSATAYQPYRKKIQLIFQDPWQSLHPRRPVFDLVSEGMHLHFPERDTREIRERVNALLTAVGIDPDSANRLPAAFSGGQRQRIGIARALAVEPDLLLCDEPVSALDVSVQAQILNLLRDLRERFSLTMVFIAHDLAVVEHMSDDILVLHRGTVVESGSASELYRSPRHSHTRALIAATPQW